MSIRCGQRQLCKYEGDQAIQLKRMQIIDKIP